MIGGRDADGGISAVDLIADVGVAMSTASAPSQNVRKGLYAKIHIARKELQLDEESYRDLLAARYGVRTAAKMSIGGLEDLVAHFVNLGWKPKKAPPKRAGSRKPAPGREAAKARAIWISLYHLGVVSDPSEMAFATYVKRQTGTDAPEWVGDWRPVTEGLKQWASRAAGVDWSGYPVLGQRGLSDHPRCRVLEAQWRLLMKAGRMKNDWGLDGYACSVLGSAARLTIFNFSDEDLDRVIEALGVMVRAERGVRNDKS